MDEMPRVSNGAKALHIASEHWARVEQELDEVTAKLEEREQKLATALGRIAELSEQLNRAEQRGNTWMLKCGQMAQSVSNMATILLDESREARKIIGDIQHGQVEQAAEELRTNGGITDDGLFIPTRNDG